LTTPARPIEESCFWMATSPAHPEPPLEGKQSADIAIVGAGFTGLWTALAIKELAPQTDVVVLEQKVAGYGGSGRNAGILGETIDHSHGLGHRPFRARGRAQTGGPGAAECAGDGRVPGREPDRL
jgi:glycine/D-amino acid oxidase-like deaminating enzyme